MSLDPRQLDLSPHRLRWSLCPSLAPRAAACHAGAGPWGLPPPPALTLWHPTGCPAAPGLCPTLSLPHADALAPSGGHPTPPDWGWLLSETVTPLGLPTHRRVEEQGEASCCEAERRALEDDAQHMLPVVGPVGGALYMGVQEVGGVEGVHHDQGLWESRLPAKTGLWPVGPC